MNGGYCYKNVGTTCSPPVFVGLMTNLAGLSTWPRLLLPTEHTAVCTEQCLGLSEGWVACSSWAGGHKGCWRRTLWASRPVEQKQAPPSLTTSLSPSLHPSISPSLPFSFFFFPLRSRPSGTHQGTSQLLLLHRPIQACGEGY